MKRTHPEEYAAILAVAARIVEREGGAIRLSDVAEEVLRRVPLLRGLKPYRVAGLLSTAAHLGGFAPRGIVLRRGVGFTLVEVPARDGLRRVA